MMNSNKIRLLGRTREDLAFFTEDESLINYEQIDSIVNSFMIKNDLKILPIDVVELSNKNGWLLAPYSKIPKNIYQLYEDIIYTDLGFTVCYNGDYIIFYNDNIDVFTQRFTVAHEIGHIALEHFVNSDPRTREIEANTFAAKMLMPLSIIKACEVKSIYEIENLCGVNYSIAKQRYTYLLNTKTHKKKELNKQFRNFIKNYKTRHNLTKMYKNPST